MKVLFLPALYYETVIESLDGTAATRFFMGRNSLCTREKALTHWCEVVLDDDFDPEQIQISVYVRHRNGKMAKILNSGYLRDREACWSALQVEAQWYQQEHLHAQLVMFDRVCRAMLAVPSETQPPSGKRFVLALAQNAHLFFRGYAWQGVRA